MALSDKLKRYLEESNPERSTITPDQFSCFCERVLLFVMQEPPPKVLVAIKSQDGILSAHVISTTVVVVGVASEIDGVIAFSPVESDECVVVENSDLLRESAFDYLADHTQSDQMSPSVLEKLSEFLK